MRAAFGVNVVFDLNFFFGFFSLAEGFGLVHSMHFPCFCFTRFADGKDRESRKRSSDEHPTQPKRHKP